MANINAPFGFRPLQRRDGVPWNGKITKRLIQNGFATSIFKGDLIVYATTGYVTRFAAAGAICDGVFLGCNYLSPVTGRREWSPYYPASLAAIGDIECDVMDDPDVLMEGQVDNTVVSIAAIGANVDITASAGEPLNGLSKEVIAGAGIAVTATLPLRIHGFTSHPDNDKASAFARLLVSLNTQGNLARLGI
jgi:hypothetical protein